MPPAVKVSPSLPVICPETRATAVRAASSPSLAGSHSSNADLLVGDGQAARGAVGVGFDAEPLHEGEGGLAGGPVVDAAEAAPRLAAHEDVLGDRQVGEERRFLVDDGDTGVACVAGAVEDDRCAVEQHLAGIGPVHPGEGLDEGGLAGAVLACQGVHLPGQQLQGTGAGPVSDGWVMEGSSTTPSGTALTAP
jgi:hypothetical protein